MELNVMHSALFVAAGVLLSAIGVIGLVLPVVPGLLLLAAAAACFARARRRG
jgi:uncharacterized protein